MTMQPEPDSRAVHQQYTETGLMDLEHHSKVKQILMKNRLNKTTTELLDLKKGWMNRTQNLLDALNIKEDDFKLKKEAFKRHVKQKVSLAFTEKLESKS